MSDTPPPPRQNADGHPCPPWCVTDHDTTFGRGKFTLDYHGGDAPMIRTPSGYVHATAYQHGHGGDAPQVALTARKAAGVMMADVSDAGRLAAIVEQLADATPEQHLALAAAIRQAAAVIAETRQATQTPKGQGKCLAWHTGSLRSFPRLCWLLLYLPGAPRRLAHVLQQPVMVPAARIQIRILLAATAITHTSTTMCGTRLPARTRN